MTTPAPPHHTFHLDGLRDKHKENSIRGIGAAVAGGFKWTDFDNCHDAQGVSWNNHSQRLMLHEGFRDPKHPRSRLKPIRRMPSAQVGRLKTADGYVVRRSIPQVLRALKAGLNVEFEVKDNEYTAAWFERLRKCVIRAGFDPARVQVKGYPKFHVSLEAAHGIFLTILLTHGARVPTAYQAFSDQHRGPVRWV